MDNESTSRSSGEGLVELDVVGGDAGDVVDDVGESGADLFGAGHAVSS